MEMKLSILIIAVCVTLSGCSKIETYVPPDYSHHENPNEESYTSILADPSKLNAGERVVAIKEKTSDWGIKEFNGFKRDDAFGYDFRSYDISKADLSVVDNYNDLSFDSNTIWPKILPRVFDPGSILESNKNPGLGIRALHDNGITGNGVGIAIIDQALLLEHEQYRDNLMYYEKIHCINDFAQMHGPAVASIAVGNTIGVAPGAKLYYIATTYGHLNEAGDLEFDASILADCIMRVLELNKHLAQGEKIRVISISKGYRISDKGYAELTRAMDRANEQNIFVLTTTTDLYYHFSLGGMERDYLKDPDHVQSYTPAWWEAEKFYANPTAFQNHIWVPAGSRTVASSTGTKDYAIGNKGGMSWAVPWYAGLYALSCQVDPTITPKKFIESVKSTSVTTSLNHDRQTYKFGGIVNPTGVIDKVKQ